jgi:hypothetical protein
MYGFDDDKSRLTWWLGPFSPQLFFEPVPFGFGPNPLRIHILHLPSMYSCNMEIF